MLDISTGNLLTTASVSLSAIALLLAWYRDYRLKRKEYADRIRNAVGIVTAKLERRKELASYFFDSIQPLLTDADVKLVNEQNVIDTRNFLWRELVSAHAKCLERITDEQLEMAYKDLYGYDPRIQELFVKAVEELKKVQEDFFSQSLHETQNAVLRMGESESSPLEAPNLGIA